MNNQLNILYFDSDQNFAKKIELILSSHHFNVYLYSDYKKVWDKCKKLNPQLLISELDFEELDILKQIGFIKKQNPQLPIIIYSSCDETDIMIRAIDIGVEDFICKDSHRINLFVSRLKSIIRRTYNEPSLIKLSPKQLTTTQQKFLK